MTWDQIARQPDPALPQLRRRFPRIDRDMIVEVGADKEAAIDKIAERHDLTKREADRELDDLLFAMRLRRVAHESRKAMAD
ncbi:hypothetical protein [Histidinibacterium aquaticum]|uniref:Uncharacterized protein n=1 Tax=Histidinibacterium aquaticum TaxID=2613962 RepID=A0A5J5GLX7_9RHOB|nr:hypothetical protein [Histidinibacterium aquaticum]KAA9009160.1 hypothetical protein F3S47_07855 [Histidinibacterium aquaticum]